MNKLVKTSTGVAPNELIFATSVNHDDHFLTTSELTISNESHHEHIKELVEVREHIINIVQDNQEEHDIHVVAERSKTYPHKSYFPINSYALVQRETQKTSKLHTVKNGPYRGLNHVGTVYTVEQLVTKVIRDFNVKLLSEYKHDENNMSLSSKKILERVVGGGVQVFSLPPQGSPLSPVGQIAPRSTGT